MAYRYRLTASLNRAGYRDPLSFEVNCNREEDILDHVFDHIANDDGEPFGPGFTLLIERLPDE